MQANTRLTREFYIRDVLELAPDLIGKTLVVRMEDNSLSMLVINDVEAYRGEEDRACHASHGRTRRTEIMYGSGGHLYVYLIYGMYWMLNIVAATENVPQAALIRGAGIYRGPGILTRSTGIDRAFNGEDLTASDRIWIEDTGEKPDFKTGPRIGIDYAGEYWKTRPWRFFSDNFLRSLPE